MKNTLLKQECDLDFFHNNGYLRKKCKSCSDYFWTLNPLDDLCGDQPCVKFNFIGNPITKKSFSPKEVRESFIRFFEKNNHSKVSYPQTGNRCPVIARWRSDIYLTIASIADFQPHATSGDVPPPANPLVISQPCIRLNDLDEVGKSGRHLTIFEMMGHHAFNKNVDEIYWKEDTVAYCNEYFQKYIGIPKEAINYKEQLWIGGGNAGPCIEVLTGGLEIATLVFMNMKEDRKGNITIEDKKYVQNPLNIVDTGYGLERISWFTKGVKTVYEAVLKETIDHILQYTKKESDMSSIYTLADHSKCLSFMLGDGIVPSNVKAGYLARLIIRRSLRLLEKLQMKLSLSDLVKFQLNVLHSDFPSLKEREDQIDEILDIETKRFSETLFKGEGLIRRMISENEKIEKNDLITLYDTHGMPPDIAQNIAKKEGIQINIPKNFDSMIAELHSHDKKDDFEHKIRENLPKTNQLYYEDHYIKEFDAKVVWKNKTDNGTEIILDKTSFYPEGGGQPEDKGILIYNGIQLDVNHVKKEGNSIIHEINGDLNIGDKVHGKIDWDYRYMLMKHHTGTHVVNGALRKIFGEHIWQAGSQLAVNEARFDFSHYKSIEYNEIIEIEKLANNFIKQAVGVEKKTYERNDAEQKFGFRLYQGGVPPGNIIRVLNIPGIDVEACGGMHINNTNEIQKIRIIKAERIQDGVNRIIFAAGKMVDKFQEKEKILYDRIFDILKDYYLLNDDKEVDISEQLKAASKIFSVPPNQLEKTIKRFLNETTKVEKVKVENLEKACLLVFNSWKKVQKNKKIVSSAEVEDFKNKGLIVPGTSIKVIIGKSESDSIALSGAIVKEENFVSHIYDGKKIVSSASENVDIDLREIAVEVGRILGGSGGGKPKLTQSGGPKKDNINEALDKALKLTVMKLKKD